jgi:hypothetical protein
MEQKTGFVGHRKAYIHAINGDGTYDIYYADNDDISNIIKGVAVVNTGSFGSGVFSAYHIGSPVWIGQSYYFQPLIVGFADIPGSIEQGNVLDSNDIDNPQVDPGEVVLQSHSGAHIDLRKTGDIKISNLKNDGFFLSDSHRSILLNSHQLYNVNDSGYTVEGRVKRFHPSYVPGTDPVFVDLLGDPEADAFTVDVARDQTQKSLHMNRNRGTANVVRNPSFAEKREFILEFADSFFVRGANIETELASEFPQALSQMDRSVAKRRGYGLNEQTFDNLRHASRTNAIRLDDNVIIERIQGTLVDIFGNVLDLNYNKINLPQITDMGSSGVSKAHSMLSRSVAYHFQVNSRNIITDTSTGNGKFTFDIDKEGQFKLNVPRSTTSGTIPTLTSFTSNNTDLNARIDINNTQLSKSGNLLSPTGGNAGTAFHDMTLTADRLIRHSIKSINPIREHSNTLSIQANGDTPNIEYVVSNSVLTSSAPQYTTTLSVQPDATAISTQIDPTTAGGRSGQINFEGSLEVSIGSDETDQKSLMLDTAGSLVAWLGMDGHGRSIVANADGSVLLNVGDYTADDNGDQTFNQGTVEIRVNLVDEKKNHPLQPGQIGDNKTTSDHIIYIGPKGIVIASGNGTPIAIRSSGDLLMEAAGTIDLKGKEIRVDAGVLRRVAPKKGDI